MKNTSRNIFRPGAVRHYQQSRQVAALPKFISRRTFVCAWAVLALVLLVGAVIWLSEFPNYLAVPAFYLTAGPGDDITLGLVVTPQEFKQVQQGQKLLLTSLDGGNPLAFTIIEIELQPRTDERIQSQFSQSLKGTPLVKMMSIVRARASDPDTSLKKLGAYQAQVQLGTSRLVSFFSAPGYVLEKQPW
jgi:hypothetical protein